MGHPRCGPHGGHLVKPVATSCSFGPTDGAPSAATTARRLPQHEKSHPGCIPQAWEFRGKSARRPASGASWLGIPDARHITRCWGGTDTYCFWDGRGVLRYKKKTKKKRWPPCICGPGSPKGITTIPLRSDVLVGSGSGACAGGGGRRHLFKMRTHRSEGGKLRTDIRIR